MCCPNPNCGRRYLSAKSFYIHTKYYCNQPSRYKCGYCEYHSAVKNYVKAHLTAKHKGLELKIDELFNPFEQKRIYTCPNDNCNRSYSSEQNVKRHLKYECGKPAMFMCFYCDYKYCFKATIKKHCNKHHPGQDFRFVTLKAEAV
ncbi:hypothetical protein KQX54_003783 [Cotesia glomerata]|uniref:C2H2-type domain-containing protein n=1 Tax=Cotesia glomerata TaxID=32391 RepID=A0AAV7IM90_COTGL|nr:hypothetical protein KQX54_003783 [Cotesia glomerata]